MSIFSQLSDGLDKKDRKENRVKLKFIETKKDMRKLKHTQTIWIV